MNDYEQDVVVMSRDVNASELRTQMRLAQRRVHAALAQIDALLASPTTNTNVVRDALLDVRLMLTDKHESRTDSDNDTHNGG